MNYTINKKKINELLINILVVISVIFPGDIFSLKKGLFFLILLYNIHILFKLMLAKKNSTIVFFGFWFPMFLFLYSALLTGNIGVSFSRSYAPYLLLLVLIIQFYDIDYDKIFLRAIYIIFIFTLLIVMLDILGIANVNGNFFRENFMYGLGVGLMGKSSTYPFYYKVFFRTSPLMVLLLFKNFDNKNLLTSGFILLSLILSGTRANVIFPIILLVFFYIFDLKSTKRYLKYFIIFVLFMLLALFAGNLVELFFETFINKGQVSDIVRQGHIKGLIELVKENPFILLTGSGMGSEFYSYGINSYTSSIEWSYIDLWRQMGVLFFILYIIFILLPILFIYETKRYKRYAYISYLLIAGTNPLLFSSTSYLMYISMYYDLKASRYGVNIGGNTSGIS